MTNTNTTHENTDIIRDQYAATARAGLSSDNAGIHAVAQAFGYSADELAAIPAQANMGLSCGNPIALANLAPGETVVDLGSGGGLDVFLAAQKVGPTGRAIGIDMTPDMIALANKNAQHGPDGKPYTNVAFKLGSIDRLPLPDNSADVIISNCVINLAPDKNAVFAEMFRVLKPGGRVAVSDIALKEGLPLELAQNVAALVGCIAGAIPIPDFEQGLHNAGFKDVAVIDTNTDLTAYAKADGHAACCTPPDTAHETEAAEPCCAQPADGGACCTPAPEPSPADAPAACCAPPTDGSSCCTPTPGTNAPGTKTPGIKPAENASPAKPLHRDLAELFQRYDINHYAASVKVFAVK